MAPFCTLKLILIGESGVGKTSLLRRFADGIFCESTRVPTLIDLKVQAIQMCGKLIKLEIWDTAGQERYRALTREYYRNSDGIILMYEVTNIETYYTVSSWLADIREYCDGVTIIVGNKNEDPESKAVQSTVVRRYADQEGLEFIETSAKTEQNVEKVFQILVRKILEKKHPSLFESSPSTRSSEFFDAIETKVTANHDDETKVTANHDDKTKVTANHDDDDDIIRLSDKPPNSTKRRKCRCLIV